MCSSVPTACQGIPPCAVQPKTARGTQNLCHGARPDSNRLFFSFFGLYAIARRLRHQYFYISPMQVVIVDRFSRFPVHVFTPEY